MNTTSILIALHGKVINQVNAAITRKQNALHRNSGLLGKVDREAAEAKQAIDDAADVAKRALSDRGQDIINDIAKLRSLS